MTLPNPADDRDTSGSLDDELLAGFALGDLDDAERDRLTLRLQQAPELNRRLEEFQSTLHLLPLALNEAAVPPPRLRRLLLDPAVPSLNADDRAPAAAGPGQRWWIPVALALGLLVTGGELWRTRSQLARYEATPSQLPGDTGDAGLRVSRSLPLRSMDAAHRISGAVQVSGSQPYNMLRLEGLPAPPPRHAYRLWARVNGKEVGCVHFVPDANGTVSMPIPPEPTSQASSLTVSLEALDAPGSGPHGPTVLSSTI
ncbi:anti-sigma factor [Synechococcus sp. CS-602]|uniref:anti-sigma factor domain-containing protein n=1 Tax=Synechococcaceae TaxID=1890426 RepID=UPI0008FF5567|nr:MULTISPECIES: anti-sigma factor [Synechococcaceae]MCT4365016.1 anti-sigma factor [Candidatus Regnicoccus frigidus MAG-AL1]APD47879.1 hypothetical protein BM449_05930 [Synechococcus sp. SynAce01]MCT0202984.1 anti-sigma factor [Synechococcus sp. CS-603]MCT0205837.1 anti-sigma factor [Synechococcus sp. CS-602]MCT0245244.1 anti-sigma factor [Synechococcus sp. CS-601]